MNGWKKCVYFFFFEQIIWKLSLFFNLPWYDCPSLFLVSVTWHAKGLSWTHQRNLQSTSKVDACQAPWAVILHAFYICICVLYGAVRNGKLTNLPLQIKIQKKKSFHVALHRGRYRKYQPRRTTTRFSAVLFKLDFYYTFVSNTNIIFIRTSIFFSSLKTRMVKFGVRKEQ